MSWQIHDKLAFPSQVLGLSKYKLSLFPKAKMQAGFAESNKRKVGQFFRLSSNTAQVKFLQPQSSVTLYDWSLQHPTVQHICSNKLMWWEIGILIKLTWSQNNALATVWTLLAGCTANAEQIYAPCSEIHNWPEQSITADTAVFTLLR